MVFVLFIFYDASPIDILLVLLAVGLQATGKYTQLRVQFSMGAFKIVAFVMLRHEASLSAMLELLRTLSMTMEKKRAKNKSDNFKCTQFALNRIKGYIYFVMLVPPLPNSCW